MASNLRRPVAALRHPIAAFRRHLRSQTRGQSLVEFALLLPIFLLVVSACLDLGRVFYANITLSNAAREGAFEAASEEGTFIQGGACDPVNNSVVCRVQLESKGSMVSIAATDITRTCSISGCPRTAGSTTTVRITGQFSLLTPVLAALFGGQTLTLTTSATAQLEYLPSVDTVSPPPAPVAEFSWSPLNPTEGESVTFDSTASTGDPTAWQWDFDGDGVADSTQQNPTHVFTAGTYTVTLTVINLTDVSSRQHTIVVDPLPSAPPSAPPSAAPSAPACAHPPNVIGQVPGTASANLINAGFGVAMFADLTNGAKNKIQAQDPDATQCVALGTTIRIHYRPS